MPLTYKDIKSGKIVFAKPEKDLPEQIKRIRDGLDSVAGRTDLNEHELNTTVEQVETTLDGITELYDELVTAQGQLDESQRVIDELKRNNDLLIQANHSLTTQLAGVRSDFEDAQNEIQQNGDALLELYLLMMTINP